MQVVVDRENSMSQLSKQLGFEASSLPPLPSILGAYPTPPPIKPSPPKG